ncbi:hypothetical protein GDO78_003667 [Eleutherodactylus coqui]|uniref:Uncharacterized protein n=1 Tax=Eleutherodactylus coqui TaxID=57060 RepID=A0A8J6EV53_ELECQ|nr:hypothetical protein GDO78_003667 [Eleutherodactylus coqui]
MRELQNAVLKFLNHNRLVAQIFLDSGDNFPSTFFALCGSSMYVVFWNIYCVHSKHFHLLLISNLSDSKLYSFISLKLSLHFNCIFKLLVAL